MLSLDCDSFLAVSLLAGEGNFLTLEVAPNLTAAVLVLILVVTSRGIKFKGIEFKTASKELSWKRSRLASWLLIVEKEGRQILMRCFFFL